MRLLTRLSLVLVGAAVSAACASEPPRAPEIAHRAQPERQRVRVAPGPSEYETEIGGLSQYDVERELEKLEPKLVACVHRSAENMTYLGGRVSLRMRLDLSGNVRWAYLNETTLGDRETERCMLSVVKSRKWPRPMSGEGLAETSFAVDPADEPRELPSYKGALLARRASAATRACRKGVRGEFMATAYFDERGRLLSVGIAPPDESGERAADCVADALSDLHIRDRGAASKVSFRFGR
jgi:hypothetical protein